MGACRESKNIFMFLKQKNYNQVWYLLKNYNKTTHEDTFMPIVCKIIGHKPYQPDANFEPDEWACRRCHRFINYNPRKEKLKKLSKIKWINLKMNYYQKQMS